MMQKIKDWLKDGPSFKVIHPEIVRRLKDGKEFERFFFYYEYQFVNGEQYYYDITNFCSDMKNVKIRVYNENKQYINQVKINLNNLI